MPRQQYPRKLEDPAELFGNIHGRFSENIKKCYENIEAFSISALHIYPKKSSALHGKCQPPLISFRFNTDKNDGTRPEGKLKWNEEKKELSRELSVDKQSPVPQDPIVDQTELFYPPVLHIPVRFPSPIGTPIDTFSSQLGFEFAPIKEEKEDRGWNPMDSKMHDIFLGRCA